MKLLQIPRHDRTLALVEQNVERPHQEESTEGALLCFGPASDDAVLVASFGVCDVVQTYASRG